MEEERSLRFDADYIANATPQELKAAEIVYALRQREQNNTWYGDPNREPGMPFLRAKEAIGTLMNEGSMIQTRICAEIIILCLVQTELYQLIRKVVAKFPTYWSNWNNIA